MIRHPPKSTLFPSPPLFLSPPTAVRYDPSTLSVRDTLDSSHISHPPPISRPFVVLVITACKVCLLCLGVEVGSWAGTSSFHRTAAQLPCNSCVPKAEPVLRVPVESVSGLRAVESWSVQRDVAMMPFCRCQWEERCLSYTHFNLLGTLLLHGRTAPEARHKELLVWRSDLIRA